MERKLEELHLSRANEHLAKMGTLVQNQEQLVEKMKMHGGDTAMALNPLALMQETRLVLLDARNPCALAVLDGCCRRIAALTGFLAEATK
ncbi:MULTISPECIES: hypothetical protein [unclassified Caballeronia]|uniref:hypothetical protein n=1 Tax=unclassified Caballeronia TaxID=2646786 RepID=UPI002027BFA1|nr:MULTISPECIES: hypothetical protein [unclassified Caballeronia]